MKSIGIFAAPQKPNVPELVTHLAALAHRHGIEVRLQPEIARLLNRDDLCCHQETDIASCDVLITFSGDGGVLKAARFAAPRGTPIWSVDLGRLGFLSAVRPGDMEPAFESLLRGEFEIEERMMLEARVLRQSGTQTWNDGPVVPQIPFRTPDIIPPPPDPTPGIPDWVDVGGSIGLNDAVVAKSALARILRFHIYVGGDLVAETRADGLVVSTPTGSTAYALSAGGPIVHPQVPLLLLCPICSHSIAQRPLVVGPDETIELHAEWEGDEVSPNVLEAMLTIDGQVGIVLRSGDRVIVRRSSLCARLLLSPHDSFYARLRQKLHWI
jgi:NAD+ kinase